MRIICLLFLAIFLSSCSSPEPNTEKETESSISTPEASQTSREAVFTYGNIINQPDKIRLSFSSEPIPFKDGYIKLVGIVGGENPLACLEIGGKGQLFSIGDYLDKYLITSINEKEVQLCLKK